MQKKLLEQKKEIEKDLLYLQGKRDLLEKLLSKEEKEE